MCILIHYTSTSFMQTKGNLEQFEKYYKQARVPAFLNLPNAQMNSVIFNTNSKLSTTKCIAQKHRKVSS